MPTAAILGFGAAISAGTAIVGELTSASDRDAAKAYTDQALQAWNNVKPQDYQALEQMLSQYRNAGMLNPQLEAGIRQGDTELRSMQRDPQLMEAQMGALEYLNKVVQGGGMTAEDQAHLNRLNSAVNTQIRGQQQAVEQNFRARGMSGSGLEFAGQMAAQQSGAQRAADQSLEIQAASERRALEAQYGRAGLAAGIRGQEMNIASAQDQINRFNANQSMAQQTWEQEQAWNRRMQDINTQAALKGQAFDEQATVAAGQSGQLNNASAQAQQRADANAARWGAAGQAALGVAGTIATHQATQPSGSSTTKPLDRPWRPQDEEEDF